MEKDNVKQLPHIYQYYGSVALLAALGLGVSIYLSLIHYWIYTDITYSSFCAISRAINCDTVAQSPWSVILGLPVSLWGVLGYLFFLFLLFTHARPSKNSPSALAFLVLLSGTYALTSIYFGYISALKIHSYCILCLIIYLVNFALFYLCWFIYRRIRTNSFYQELLSSCRIMVNDRIFIALMTLLLTIGVGLQIFLPQYWILDNLPISINIPTGVTDSGHPWIGAENPKLTIEEFSDYQCFQCAKSHLILRRLVAKHPDVLRLVHRHYPMDHKFNPTVVPEPFHIGSGKMSLLAIYAMTKGKFWEMNDALFQLGRGKKPFNTQLLAKKTGIPSPELVMALSYPAIKQQLDHDILRGMKLRILGTPSFVIQGKVYTGQIPLDVLNRILKDNN